MPAPKGQSPAKKSSGIADDASDYENLPQASPSAKRSNAQSGGIAEDAKAFEGLIDETTDKARTLDSDWLYQRSGQVFGPVKPRDLLELLYSGQIDKDTPIALDGGEFEALHRYGVFRVHLPKVAKHQMELAEAKAEEERAAKARIWQRARWAVLAIVIAVAGGWGTYQYIWKGKEEKAQAEAKAKEAKLLKEIDDLMASVTIEPPLVALVDEAAEAKDEQSSKAKKKHRAFAHFSGGSTGVSSATELSHQEVMTGIASAFPSFKRCIVEQMQRDAESVPEQIMLSFSINNDGVIQNLTLPDRAVRNTPLGDCLSRHLSQVRFRKYKGEVQNVEYPITIGRR